ncbi:hypothetical protein PENTCL1PPCAC_8071, partial [Pristionchus entomophagus]
ALTKVLQDAVEIRAAAVAVVAEMTWIAKSLAVLFPDALIATVADSRRLASTVTILACIVAPSLIYVHLSRPTEIGKEIRQEIVAQHLENKSRKRSVYRFNRFFSNFSRIETVVLEGLCDSVLMEN